MRNSFVILLVILFISGTETKAQLNSPESVCYDHTHNRYLISNAGNGIILQRSASGVLTNFVTGLNSPKGLVVYGNALYMTDVTNILGYDLNTGTQVLNVPITGASFLNDIDAYNGFLYASDMNTNKIHKIDISAQTYTTPVSSGLSAPNGVLVDVPNNRLLIVSYDATGSVKAMDLTSFTLTTVIASTGYTNLDGLTRDTCGNFYISSWGTGNVYKYTPSFTSPVIVASGFSGPADIFFNRLTDTLVVPDMNNSTLTFSHQVCSPAGIAPVAKNLFGLELSPNPATDEVKLKFHLPKDPEKVQIRLINSDGKDVYSCSPVSDSCIIDLRPYPSGQYLVRISEGQHSETCRLFKVRH